MRAFTLIAMLVPFLFASGCAKRGAKPTAHANTETAGVKVAPQAPAPANTDMKSPKEKDAEPNWVKVAPGGKKDEPPQLPVDGAASSGKKPWNVGAPPVPGPAGQVPGAQPPEAGVLQPNQNPVPPIAPPNNTPLGAAARVAALADMRDLQIFIHDASLVTGKMPTAAEIYAALVAAGSKAAPLVKDGAIILTGAKERESVWAFEARAYLSGGMVVTQNGVERVTAAELKQRLGK